MFCPRCGATPPSEELKYCKSCGANLYAVRQVVDTRETEQKFDWSKTWVAEMMLSGDEATRRQALIDFHRGLTPEVKRYNEIKAGVITFSVGLGLVILLYFLMQGIILGGKIPNDTAEILSRIWVAGVIPILVGIALMINGIFISKRIVESSKKLTPGQPNSLEEGSPVSSLRPANTTEFSPYSVTENTTQHLRASTDKK